MNNSGGHEHISYWAPVVVQAKSPTPLSSGLTVVYYGLELPVSILGLFHFADYIRGTRPTKEVEVFVSPRI